MRIGIVGTGLIGNKRANAILASNGAAKVQAVTDVSRERAEKLASVTGAALEKDWRSLLSRPDIDAVFIATTNDVIPEIAIAALQAGKHALIEKPGGRGPEDVGALAKVARASDRVLGVGFNHRFHPALLRAKELVDSLDDGPVMYIRARYGHGGRLGYEKEWRANPKISGGGELLDQGVHLIDLCRWYCGDMTLQFGHSGTFFWQMPVEDNGFMLLTNKTAKAHLHASCTEWKNIFDFEIFCKNAKIEIFGLGGSYGVEELRYFKMKPEMGPPDITITPFPGPDQSWALEQQAFFDKIAGKRTKHTEWLGNVNDALRSVEIVHEVYKSS